MRRIKVVAWMAITSFLLLGIVSTAGARGLNSQGVDFPLERAFEGSRAELVGYVLPQLIERAGMALDPAAPSLCVDLQREFNGSDAFQWANTMVTRSGANGQAFSFTLPSDFNALSRGELALGIVEEGNLSRAFRVQMSVDPRSGELEISFSRPQGQMEARMQLEVGPQGELLLIPNQLFSLAGVLFPSNAKGTFDPIIQTLQGIINMLYEVKGLINMSICVVNEMIEMFYDLNLCGWGETRPGHGAFISLIVCTIQDVAEFLNEATGSCL